MKLLVTIQSHMQAIGDDVFSHHLTYDRFWKRYLSAFDEVVVLSRIKQVEEVSADCNPVSGPGVRFHPLPDFQGPWQYIKKRKQILSKIQGAMDIADAYILRVPGAIETLLWKNLPAGYPYGVEVVVDPWEIFAPGSVKSIGRPYFRYQWTRDLKMQCRNAAAASYVTEYVLQKRYPPSPDAFKTNYSSIELDEKSILSDMQPRIERYSSFNNLSGNNNVKPMVLGFVGSFSQGHKLTDVHIKAFAKCVARGDDILLEMIGGGTLLDDMKRLTQKLGVADRVIFRGRISGGKPVMDALDGIDLFLNATAAEGLPRVVIEAMARGCPSIGSTVAGIPELLSSKFLVPPGDVEALSNKISTVVKSPDMMIQAVKDNVEVARKYTCDVLRLRREAFYNEIRGRTEKYLTEKK